MNRRDTLTRQRNEIFQLVNERDRARADYQHEAGLRREAEAVRDNYAAAITAHKRRIDELEKDAAREHTAHVHYRDLACEVTRALARAVIVPVTFVVKQSEVSTPNGFAYALNTEKH